MMKLTIWANSGQATEAAQFTWFLWLEDRTVGSSDLAILAQVVGTPGLCSDTLIFIWCIVSDVIMAPVVFNRVAQAVGINAKWPQIFKNQLSLIIPAIFWSDLRSLLLMQTYFCPSPLWFSSISVAGMIFKIDPWQSFLNFIFSLVLFLPHPSMSPKK